MMTTEDKKKALTTPSSVFKHPAEVVDPGQVAAAGSGVQGRQQQQNEQQTAHRLRTSRCRSWRRYRP